MNEVESVSPFERAALHAPRPVLRAGFWFIPSMIYIARTPGQ
jgi:hypothetical protein